MLVYIFILIQKRVLISELSKMWDYFKGALCYIYGFNCFLNQARKIVFYSVNPLLFAEQQGC